VIVNVDVDREFLKMVRELFGEMTMEKFVEFCRRKAIRGKE